MKEYPPPILTLYSIRLDKHRHLHPRGFLILTRHQCKGCGGILQNVHFSDLIGQVVVIPFFIPVAQASAYRSEEREWQKGDLQAWVVGALSLNEFRFEHFSVEGSYTSKAI